MAFEFRSQLPQLDLSDGSEMLTDFSRESQRHLISARNSMLVLETVSTDQDVIENIFKTFHTISGLADFLKLNDIFWITKTAEQMMDLVRKKVLSFDGRVHDLAMMALKRLQELFELLDEQIECRGKLKSPYPDQTELVKNMHNIVSHPDHAVSAPVPGYVNTEVPKISLMGKTNFYDSLRQKIESVNGNIIIRKEPLSRLLDDFKILEGQLKEAQEKIQERQKELIKERELALKLTRKAQHEAKSKSEYLANMSHEIRTLINAILGFTDLIKDELPANSRQIDHLNTIIVSGKMLLEIVNNILDFSKVEAGKLKLEEIPFDLREIVEDVFQMIRSRLDRKPVNLYLDIDSNVPIHLIGDPTRLKQIFMNLLDNAIKFTERGEIGLSVRLGRQQGKSNEPALYFTMKDTGIGIPDDRKNMVFDSFIQADASTTRLYGGTGLGLALCKAFVDAMGGSIWIDSELGSGSEFNFVIQFRKAKEDAGAKSPELEYQGLEKILVVTPFEKTIKMFQYVFDHLTVTPLSLCRNIKHAREVLTSLNRPPDIIFVDALFDAGQAVAFAQDIRNQDVFRLSKIAVISSDIKYFEKFSSNDHPFDGIIFTPIMLKEFVAVVKKMSSDGKTAVEQEDQEAVERNRAFFKDIKILVVEDSIPNQELLRVHFEDLGCYCDYASNGKEAIECLRRLTYDLCFMDLQMPVMGGIESTVVIRNELKLDLPIIALTAAEVQEEKEKCLSVGMNDYLPKPFDVDQLKEKIRKFANK
jgi:signal transduction histidine kinase/CheY-like chemotaxis protein